MVVDMNDVKNQGSTQSSPLAALVFYTLNLILFPVMLLGYILWIAKMYLVGRSSGVSLTAQGPLSARWLQHMLGTRPDGAAARLLMVVPGFSHLAAHLFADPILFASRLTGFVPKTFRYPFEGDVPPQAEASARTTFFDGAVERYLPAIDQFVILGAGFDTRPYRLPKQMPVRSFEVDAPKTQAVKREMLKEAGIDASGVTFVSADFEKEDWLKRLGEAGFDIHKPALILWEGVIMYLEREAVEETLHKVAGLAEGSVLAFDYFTTEPLLSNGLYWRYGRAATKAAGEPMKFGVDSTPPSRERLAELLHSCGLTLVEQHTLGDETKGQRAWGGFAIAVVKYTQRV